VIQLSIAQVMNYAVPMIRQCMGAEVGSRAEGEFSTDSEGDSTGLYGLFDRGTLICIAGIGSEISSKKVWLGYLAVHPDYRGKGLGKHGLQYVEEVARDRGYEWMFVETYGNPIFDAAISLYEASGYIHVGELLDYLDDGSDVVYLRKTL